METTAHSKNTLDEKVRYGARVALGVMLIVGSISLIKENGFLTALFIALGGLLVLPAIADKLNNIFKGNFGFTAQLISVFALFVVGVMVSTDTPDPEPLTEEQVRQIVDEALAEQQASAEESQPSTLETEEETESPEVKQLKTQITSKEAEISLKKSYIESLDPPFEEYQRLNDMYMAAGNMSANKDQYFINVWQGEINQLETEVSALEQKLSALE